MRRQFRVMFVFAIVLALLSVATTAKKGARKQRQQNEVLKPRNGNNNNNNNNNNKCKTVRKSCQPRNTYVEIQSDDINKFVYQVVQVKRCSGLCIGYKRCLPTSIVNTTMSIKGRGKCEQITVEEHRGCKCDCKIKQKECQWPRIYVKERCDCTCSMHFINECNRDKKKTANQENCTCKCNDERECTTGTRWSSEECSCVREESLYETTRERFRQT